VQFSEVSGSARSGQQVQLYYRVLVLYCTRVQESRVWLGIFLSFVRGELRPASKQSMSGQRDQPTKAYKPPKANTDQQTGDKRAETKHEAGRETMNAKEKNADIHGKKVGPPLLKR